MSFNILLVDDSATTRAIIVKTIELAGIPVHKIYQAGNGREALDIMQEAWVDLIFMDINMPVMNGVELIEQMAEDGLLTTIPVVIVSTEGSVKRIEELKAKGAYAYLRKPFTPEQIRGIVHEIMEKKNEYLPQGSN